MDNIPEENCTIVVPAYNEEKRILRFLDEALLFGGRFIFVCDGTDKTDEIVKKFGEENPGLKIKIIRSNTRLGKGGGIIEGIKAAETDYAGFVDADGSTSVSELKRLFSGLDRYDCVIGSRWLPESKVSVKQSLSRRIQSRIFNLAIRVLFSLPYRDTQCGAKVFRKKSLDRILPDVTSRGFEFDVEILWCMKKAGCKIHEVPISWNDMELSHVGGGDGIKMIYNLVKIRFG
ncbi:glycosyltransferase [Methanoplanus sp. FWC-SCC4]|uniref:Glycosyltransferase n=1 Tax=Methanochimaera problematica TaxID=2609417 RepID=A0AA97FDB2_9EURY|nr:glycosyltransferase [Methanoplanus sp. FWC-SCC4]WOF15366.1 glycosyltransferase [Methanoplanus sp. FWC-SCC4]